MAELNEALPTESPNIPMLHAATYASNSPQYQYHQSSPPVAYPPGQYAQPYSGGQSPATFRPGQPDSQYYTFTPGQPSDPSQLQFQYGRQVRHRVPGASPVTMLQYSTGLQGPMQPQGYSVPGHPYQYPQGFGPRAMSVPTYTNSPSSQSPQHLLQPTSYPVSPTPSQHPKTSPIFSDEGSISTDPDHLLPRGPPRKPKQSGFAIWVGNLPRDVLLEELKEFFALDGLESIFLIRKSSCAFVNYRTEEACSLALLMFNDKRN